MTEKIIEDAMRELTRLSQPPPLTVAQPATLVIAKKIFEELNSQRIVPNGETIFMLLLENGWEEKHAKYLIKKFKNYLR